jgi:hypothetical protein
LDLSRFSGLLRICSRLSWTSYPFFPQRHLFTP